MASGHRDRTLRITGEDGKPRPIKSDLPEGLRWEPMMSSRMRVLLPRGSALRATYPCADDIGLRAGTRLWAVGTSMMLLGDSMIALESPTLLPAGSEWLALVMRARDSKHVAAEGGDLELALSEARVTLSSNQVALAEEIASCLDLHALRPQARALELLRAALEPWVASSSAAEDEDASEEPCPICLMVVHNKSRQRPRLRCATCRHGMHATCIFRWLDQRAESSGDRQSKCPLCQSTL